MAAPSEHKPGEPVRAAEELARLVIDSVRDYAIFMVDRQGYVQTWNPGAEAIKGYQAHEIIGKHIETFYTAEDRAAGLPARLLGEAEREGRVENEGFRVRKDGSRFWADIVISALRDETGELIGFSKVSRDLSEKRLAESALRTSEERFRLLVDSVKDHAIFMLDPKGIITTWNEGARRIKGYEAAEIIGRHFSVFYPREEAAAGKCERELEIAEREGRFEEEGIRVRKDGLRFWSSVVISAVHDQSGKLIGFAKVTRDLTERRRAEDERIRLAKAQETIRLRDEFLSIASHELKTPVTAVHLQLQAALRRTGDEKVRALLERSNKNLDRLGQLINTLLDVSRFSGGDLVLDRELLDLGELALSVADGLREMAVYAGSPITVSAQPGIVGRWDRLRIEQVVGNLVSNAVKYAAGKPIAVFVERQGTDAILTVTDGGPGVAAEDRQRIFQRFERAAPVRHFGGFGLGLYITKEIVVGHGGAITFEEAPGGGAAFRVTLPLAA
jgi:PAS domain S-box-containing protein